MKSVSDAEPIFEENECCVACGGTVNVGLFDDVVPVCGPCYANGRFKEWFIAETEKALDESPDYERLPN